VAPPITNEFLSVYFSCDTELIAHIFSRSARAGRVHYGNGRPPALQRHPAHLRGSSGPGHLVQGGPEDAHLQVSADRFSINSKPKLKGATPTGLSDTFFRGALKSLSPRVSNAEPQATAPPDRKHFNHTHSDRHDGTHGSINKQN